jgi:hypothetical protein
MSASANRLTSRFTFLDCYRGACYQSSRFDGDCLAWPALFAVAVTSRQLGPCGACTPLGCSLGMPGDQAFA